MKNFKLYAAAFVFFSVCAGTAALDSETSFVVFESKSGVTNLAITDKANGKIVLSKASVQGGRQIFLLPKSDYVITTSTLKTNISINDDGTLNIQGGKFVFTPFPKPEALVFYRGDPEKFTLRPIERSKYTLAFLDFDNFDKFKARNYSVNIKGASLNQDIEFDSSKTNNRFVSAEQISFPAAGRYTITISAPSGAVPVSAKVVDVIPRPPLNVNITNTWGSGALQFAAAEIYKISAAEAKSLSAVMTKEKYEEFKYNRAILSRTNTGAEGKLTVSNIRDGEAAAIIVSGAAAKDVYVKTIIANEDAPNVKLNWQDIPSKGKEYEFTAQVNSTDAEHWNALGNDFNGVCYYAAGLARTIRRDNVIKSPSFFKIDFKKDFRKTEDREGIIFYIDLRNVSAVTNINYLIVIKSNAGTFSMQNTADEFSATPRLDYEPEAGYDAGNDGWEE